MQRSKLPSCTDLLHGFTYNIHHGEGTDGVFDLERIADVILASGADLVALQEVDVGTKRASGVDQAQALADLTGMEVRFGEAIPYSGGSYGEALLSRWPILETVRMPLPASPGHELRVAVAITVEPDPGHRLRLIGTHLDHTKDSGDRELQVQALLEMLEGDSVPSLLVGDLNAEPGSVPMQLLLTAGWRPSDPERLPTFPSVEPRRKIDWILLGPGVNLQPVAVEALHEPIASDHCPLLVTLAPDR
ncbi:MAG: endonuclease/exonuclease/phosphatase family protein [Planctomycetota bacterium]